MNAAHVEVDGKLLNLKNQHADLVVRNRKLKEDLLHVQFQATEVDFQLSQEKRKSLILQNRRLAIESDMSTRHVRVTEMLRNLDAKKEALRSLEHDRDALIPKVESLRTKLDGLQREVEELEQQRKVLPDRLEELEKELEYVDREERHAAEELKAAQIALSKLKDSEAGKIHSNRETEVLCRENGAIAKRKALDDRKNRLGEFTDVNDLKRTRSEVSEDVRRLEEVLKEKQNELNTLLGIQQRS